MVRGVQLRAFVLLGGANRVRLVIGYNFIPPAVMAGGTFCVRRHSEEVSLENVSGLFAVMMLAEMLFSMKM